MNRIARFLTANDYELRILKNAEKEIVVYRGVTLGGTKRFLGEHFSEDKKFSKMFGEVSTYKLKLRNVLDLTKTSNVKKYFGEDMVRYFQSGDFWKTQTDKDGFNVIPINEIVAFAKKNNFSIIKYVENFSSNIKPVNYLVLNDSLYKKTDNIAV